MNGAKKRWREETESSRFPLGLQPPPSLCTDEWGKLIRLHRMLPVSLLILFHQGFASLLLEPVAYGFTEQLRAFLMPRLGDCINLLQQVLVNRNRDRFHSEEE